MAIRIVPLYATDQPDDLLDAEGVREPGLDRRPVQRRVASGVQQAVLGRLVRAGSIDVHRAALQHHARREARNAERARN